jgi:iron-sulfur cluster repair protein YtfE (RIC family)
MNDTIFRYLTDDHRRCDHLLADCEKQIDAKAWQAVDAASVAFQEALLHHFTLEEEVLFPELEQINPAAGAPAGVMRMEHRQMRQLLEELASAVRARDKEACLGNLETLHMISQQHNAKEEGILYPLADRSLQDGADALIERMRAT